MQACWWPFVPRPTNPVVGLFRRLPQASATTAASRKVLETRRCATGDKITGIAIYAVIGDTGVDGGSRGAGVVVHVALRKPGELLGTIKEWNVAAAIQVVQFYGCEVDCLAVARGVVVVYHGGRRRFPEHVQERRLHHGRLAVAHSGG